MTIADCGPDSLHLAALNVSRLQRQQQQRRRREIQREHHTSHDDDDDDDDDDATASGNPAAAAAVVDTSLVDPVFTSEAGVVSSVHHSVVIRSSE